MGLAFADTLVAGSQARVVIVDRHARPGGHWNDAYSFVRLHSPAAYYGVDSLPLGEDSIDTSGHNEGLYELASGAEVCGYFDRVMQRKLLSTGRVRYFPMCEHQEGGRFVSLVSGDEYRVAIQKKLVDATYTNTAVPSTHEPAYAVAEGVRCIPVNDLTRTQKPAAGYVVIGAGKTAMDACLWLLDSGVAPERIRWVRPRDAWLLDRAYAQPGEGLGRTFLGAALTMEAAAQAESIDELFQRLNAVGQLLRLDDRVEPSMFHCATVSQPELQQLRRIGNVVRLGHVERIERDRIVLQQGTIPTSLDQVHVDCTSRGIARRPALPVFAPDRITLQAVRSCLPAYSAALIGHLEATRDDAAAKNALCPVVPYPDRAVDWIPVTLGETMGRYLQSQDPGVRAWAEQTRLNAARGGSARAKADPEMAQALARYRRAVQPALGKLQGFLGEL
jgi:hypothetical protein